MTGEITLSEIALVFVILVIAMGLLR